MISYSKDMSVILYVASVFDELITQLELLKVIS